MGRSIRSGWSRRCWPMPGGWGRRSADRPGDRRKSERPTGSVGVHGEAGRYSAARRGDCRRSLVRPDRQGLPRQLPVRAGAGPDGRLAVARQGGSRDRLYHKDCYMLARAERRSSGPPWRKPDFGLRSPLEGVAGDIGRQPGALSGTDPGQGSADLGRAAADDAGSASRHRRPSHGSRASGTRPGMAGMGFSSRASPASWCAS